MGEVTWGRRGGGPCGARRAAQASVCGSWAVSQLPCGGGDPREASHLGSVMALSPFLLGSQCEVAA